MVVSYIYIYMRKHSYIPDVHLHTLYAHVYVNALCTVVIPTNVFMKCTCLTCPNKTVKACELCARGNQQAAHCFNKVHIMFIKLKGHCAQSAD